MIHEKGRLRMVIPNLSSSENSILRRSGVYLIPFSVCRTVIYIVVYTVECFMSRGVLEW